MNIIKILEKLTKINGVSGNEEDVRNFISEEMKKYCDEVYTDAMGNLIAHKKGNGKKVMLAAHMDEIGIMVTNIDENGFLSFTSMGGLNTPNLSNLRVEFKNGIKGVIGAREEEFRKKASLDKLYIDIGVSSKKEAEKLICIGDVAAFEGSFYKKGNTVVSKALDNRAGCAILIGAASMIKTDNDVYFVFTTQEEVGLRGAKTAAFAIEPDIAIAVDVTDTGDTPDAPTMAVKIGGGVAIKVMDNSVICDAEVRTLLIETAKKNKIAYQLEIMTDGGTDAGAIHLTKAGIKTGGVSVPTRYIHSPSEMINTEDFENCTKLIAEAVKLQW